MNNSKEIAGAMAFVVNQAASWPFPDAIFRLEDCIDTDSEDIGASIGKHLLRGQIH
jgi:hypothetical protein